MCKIEIKSAGQDGLFSFRRTVRFSEEGQEREKEFLLLPLCTDRYNKKQKCTGGIMEEKGIAHLDFLLEMSERQISAREFFTNVLLDALERNFHLEKVLLLCFDTGNHFLSWTDRSGISVDHEQHPYHRFAEWDPVRMQIYTEAVRDHLTYFNVEPRLYVPTSMYSREEYEASSYVRFLEENFRAHYSVRMALGLNAYIEILFFKSKEEGDFTPEEVSELEQIYVYVANSYKNFKKHEQTKIVSNIQDEIIQSGEKAYLVTDDFMHLMSCNQTAAEYLRDILGTSFLEEPGSERRCPWLPFLLGSEEGIQPTRRVQTRVVQNYIFKIYTYDQHYRHGIVDRYHWITISPREQQESAEETGLRPQQELPLTRAEWRVARLLEKGLTYQAIADELVISYHTVKHHVQNIYGKCGVQNRYQMSCLLENKIGNSTYKKE